MQMTCNARLVLTALSAAAAFGQGAGNPVVGRWDFNLPGPRGGAVWLGVTQKAGAFDVWYQPSGGNVLQLKDFTVTGSHIRVAINPSTTWELDAAGDKISGVQKRGEASTPLSGARAPALDRKEPAAWTTPEPLFNGRNLDGWTPIGDVANSHWVVKDGLLVNEEKGANLKSDRTFDDLKAHFEVKCPDGGNSGFYLRGRYEVQIEYEPLSENPPERRIGSIYGRITPKDIPRTPGQWETFDVMLVGRTVTITRNGVLTVDHQEIEGITGGALDANEGEPGPFYLQGDHTGGLSFRNITVSVPRK
jgi:hypothetical protein